MTSPQLPTGRSIEDLYILLNEIIQGIAISSKAYDEGYMGEAKRLATSIRVLVHDKRKSFSLLHQLKVIDELQFYSIRSSYNENNLLTESRLTFMRLESDVDGTGDVTYIPKLDDGPPLGWDRLQFLEWWEQEIIRDSERRTLTRKDIVLIVANQDGGAHVDPKLDVVYEALSRKNSLGWIVSDKRGERAPARGPHYACIRHISYEIERTISEYLTTSMNTK